MSGCVGISGLIGSCGSIGFGVYGVFLVTALFTWLAKMIGTFLFFSQMLWYLDIGLVH